MIKNSQNQIGSAHIVIIVILVLAIIGALGFVVYRNFISKDTQSNNVPVSKNNDQREALPVTKEFRSQRHNITFKYPSSWTVVENIQVDSPPDWYGSDVKIKNEKNEIVAMLSTGGQFGGTCDDSMPLIPTSTIIKDNLELKGVVPVNFGYTIVETGKENFGVAFGLGEDKILTGNESVRCPGISINYRYIFNSENTSIGGMTFGLWYGESPSADNPNTYRKFKSFSEAQSFSQSDEFKKIESTIKSLNIGS